MFRGTSPTVRIKTGAAIADALGKYYITFAQSGKELFTVDDSQCQMTSDGTTACIEFTVGQDKTLLMEAGLDVDIQMRAITKTGKATASRVESRPVFEILHEGFIS